MSVAMALEGFVHVPVRWSIRNRVEGTQGKVGIAEVDFMDFEAMVEEQTAKRLSQSSDGSIGDDELVLYYAGMIEKNGRPITLNDRLTTLGNEYAVRSAGYRVEGEYTKVTMKRTTREATTVGP